MRTLYLREINARPDKPINIPFPHNYRVEIGFQIFIGRSNIGIETLLIDALGPILTTSLLLRL